MESQKRSLAKTISWRIVATVTTITLVYIFTGSVTLSLGVGVLDVILKMLFYYIHERVWNNNNWGRK